MSKKMFVFAAAYVLNFYVVGMGVSRYILCEYACECVCVCVCGACLFSENVKELH